MPRSHRHSRKAKPLPESLRRQLTLYALAAGAAGVGATALAQPAEAQIVYTPADEVIERNGEMLIDLNHDGITDVLIREVFWTYGSDGFFPGNSVRAVTRVGNGVAGISGWASDLTKGATIGPPDFSFPGPAVMFEDTNDGEYYGGYWAFVKDRYLGIRFKIDGETHYGWARLSMKVHPVGKGITAQLTGYAYETQADKPIRAGDTGQKHSEEGQSSKMVLPAQPKANQPPTLGALAVGANGLPAWRSDQSR